MFSRKAMKILDFQS